jgi:RNA polymerase sigma-70 factor, ECF subfamily
VDIAVVIERSRTGDKTAYAELVSHYRTPLFAFLGRLGMPQGQAEDIAQEVFVRAWQHLGRFDAQRAAFSTWLFTFARNLAINELQRASTRKESADDEALLQAHCERPQPLGELLAEERQRLLQAALRQLPLADRSVLALAYLSDLDQIAIAQIEGCSVGAIKTRLHRARHKLRQLMETGND